MRVFSWIKMTHPGCRLDLSDCEKEAATWLHRVGVNEHRASIQPQLLQHNFYGLIPVSYILTNLFRGKMGLNLSSAFN